MVKFQQLREIIDEVISQLNKIAEDMGRYSKIDTDYRARALIDEINEKTKQMNNTYKNVFAHKDFKDVYGENSNYDYTEYVQMIRAYVPKYKAIYERIVKFENVFGLY